jgi:hypothetical protein
MPICIIVEDEKLLSEQLKEALAQTWPELVITDEADDGMTGAFAKLVINTKILLLACHLRNKWLCPFGYLRRKTVVDARGFDYVRERFRRSLLCHCGWFIPHFAGLVNIPAAPVAWPLA